MIDREPEKLTTLLDARAAHFRKPRAGAAGNDDANAIRGLAMAVAELVLVIPEAALFGLVRHPRVIPVSGQPAACLGIVQFRSRFFDVFCASRLLGWAAPSGAIDHLVFCEIPGFTFALSVGLPQGLVSYPSSGVHEIARHAWPAALPKQLAPATFLLDLSELTRHPAFQVKQSKP